MGAAETGIRHGQQYPPRLPLDNVSLCRKQAQHDGIATRSSASRVGTAQLCSDERARARERAVVTRNQSENGERATNTDGYNSNYAASDEDEAASQPRREMPMWMRRDRKAATRTRDSSKQEDVAPSTGHGPSSTVMRYGKRRTRSSCDQEKCLRRSDCTYKPLRDVDVSRRDETLKDMRAYASVQIRSHLVNRGKTRLHDKEAEIAAKKCRAGLSTTPVEETGQPVTT
ncbi:hypothetical protein SPI_02047 [Niveomyces insectorum RCEF 264]|uniref:Uncharacterized protein n=1 Tax=Niveomyces insectorum RCEF 264 TaxID=1081102 RepID=A0A162MQH3_9HYPO|nr:hypothetical protein SPI_02047 [Niveomyces insectorum RCEF 264]